MKPSKISLKQSNPKSGVPHSYSMPAILGMGYGWDLHNVEDGPEVALCRFFRAFPNGSFRWVVGQFGRGQK